MINITKDTKNINDRIKDNNKELIALASMGHTQKNLSVEVLKRFLNEEELKTFFEKYNSSKLTRGFGGSRNRAVSLSEPIGDLEMEMLNAYLSETETSLKELELRFKLKTGTFTSRVHRYAIKYLYQNRDLVGL